MTPADHCSDDYLVGNGQVSSTPGSSSYRPDSSISHAHVVATVSGRITPLNDERVPTTGDSRQKIAHLAGF